METLHDTFMRQNASYSIRRLCSIVQPLQSLFSINVYDCWILSWIVCSNYFDIASVTWCTCISSNNSVKRCLLSAHSL